MEGNIHLLPILITVILPIPQCAETLHLNILRVIQVSRRVTWGEAQDYCRKYYTDLVTIRDEEAASRLVPLEGWIGLHQRQNRQWKWSQGDEPFDNWELCKYKLWITVFSGRRKLCIFKVPVLSIKH